MTNIQDIGGFVSYVHRRLADDWDLLLPIYGDVGSGKSYAAFCLGHALDETFSWDRHEFSSQTYINQMKELPEGRAGVWDEVVEGGLRVRTTAQDEVETLKEFIANREAQQVHLICVPQDSLLLKWLAKQRPDWRVLVNREVGWDYSIMEIEERKTNYNRYKDKWSHFWKTRLRYVLKPDLLESEGWRRYKRKKKDWRLRLGRDADAAMKERVDSEDRQVVDEYKRRLEWFPDEVEGFQEDFLSEPVGLGNNGVGLSEEEKRAKRLIEAYQAGGA